MAGESFSQKTLYYTGITIREEIKDLEDILNDLFRCKVTCKNTEIDMVQLSYFLRFHNLMVHFGSTVESEPVLEQSQFSGNLV
ncbi:9003_t:CDS:2 [Dentiscutata heterogama]|uniref:9003_t:CDS:1 n=1 Tax=Dentiscutata heterogama TaxID=1316150 RepID=A0ACA9KVV4_9GLOM|nr:9003_t:CDS:2 [Dentiscutata heterogama]